MKPLEMFFTVLLLSASGAGSPLAETVTDIPLNQIESLISGAIDGSTYKVMLVSFEDRDGFGLMIAKATAGNAYTVEVKTAKISLPNDKNSLGPSASLSINAKTGRLEIASHIGSWAARDQIDRTLEVMKVAERWTVVGVKISFVNRTSPEQNHSCHFDLLKKTGVIDNKEVSITVGKIDLQTMKEGELFQTCEGWQ